MVRFLCSSNNTTVQIYINNISNLYTKKHFKQLYTLLFIDLQENPFLTIHIKNYIVQEYYKNIRLKNAINNLINKYKTYHIHQNKIIINTKTLLFEPFTNICTRNLLEFPCKNSYKKFHVLTLYELTQLFNTAIFSQSDGFPTPTIPKNPYTGETFTLKQQLMIYNRLNYRIDIPMSIKILKESHFSITRLEILFHNYLTAKAAQSYIYNLEVLDWLDLFLEYFKFHKLKKITCLKCIFNLTNIRELFSAVLIRYFLEENSNVEYTINSRKMSILLFKNLGVINNNKDCKLHRKILKLKRGPTFSFNINNTTTLNFTKNTNNNTNNNNLFVFTSKK